MILAVMRGTPRMNFLVRNNPLLGRPLQAGATLGVLALLVAGSGGA